VIKKSVKEVFEIVQNIEGHQEFMADFNKTKIHTKESDKIIFERSIKIANIPLTWKSVAKIEKNRLIQLEHIEGILRGLRTEWKFKPIKEGTEVRIIHNLDGLKVPVIRSTIGKLVIWNLLLKKICNKMLKNLKASVESQERQSEDLKERC
jgi:ribosome-associated toxin RatA of RatAB toxin-antitoxin module